MFSKLFLCVKVYAFQAGASNFFFILGGEEGLEEGSDALIVLRLVHEPMSL